ncbi:hypothetical protein M409DRAFT_67337 [Zasmidium cellare ATCC 36951]|uniref:Cytochrome P450 n=1 Tax=Zasmidium cellare ATCC 36951 TaxID=1080233 RepID=A0A6A6CEL2_ZASCE|nr:uncharacterized protein M409DRAFT_67337 [Zasmidium cellare ATCC 36951]KAF2165555.1 hypothetical protein M409DRAFT_67337 [Zasmidium cellare ATCC 36951]
MATLPLVLSGLLVAGLLLYRAALPRLLPGIPHDAKSSRRLFGDLPDGLQYAARTKEFLSFLSWRCEQLGSPIVQVSLRPFQKPLVVVSDSRETFDILHRRGRDFDQSDGFRLNFSAAWPNSTVTMRTGEQWRYNRRLVVETMSPAFLRDIDGPTTHKMSLELMKLWRRKAERAQGRPFDVQSDLNKVTNDVIWQVLLGTEVRAVKSQIEYLSSAEKVDLPASVDEVVALPEGSLPEVFNAFGLLAESSTIARKSVFGSWAAQVAVRVYPELSRAWRLKNAIVKRSARDAWNKFKDIDLVDKHQATSAAEFVVQREVKQAQKEGRKPEGPSKWLEGELAIMLAAGYDTTASSMSWGLNYLSIHQDVQAKIRRILRETFPKAVAESREPSPAELYNTALLYLDAFIEEVLRCSQLIPSLSRTTITNTRLLGYDIPIGTTVVSPHHRPKRTAPRSEKPSTSKGPPDTKLAPVKDSARTSSGEEFQPQVNEWDDTSDDLQNFRPERYMPSKEGDEHLDLMAGPHVTFGGGTRGCFGKKIAYLNMRILLAIIVWNFELLPLPDELSGLESVEANTVTPRRVPVRLRPLAG